MFFIRIRFNLYYIRPCLQRQEVSSDKIRPYLLLHPSAAGTASILFTENVSELPRVSALPLCLPDKAQTKFLLPQRTPLQRRLPEDPFQTA